jgi:hypothetical protein
MINPLPIELRPDFIKEMNASKQQGPTDWLPIVVAGGLCILVIYIVYKRSNDSARKRTDTLNQNHNQPFCPMQPNRWV